MNSPAPALLRMASEDNCAIAIRTIEAGEIVRFEDQLLHVAQTVPLGHKVAVQPLRPGDKVLRYGALIGSVTAAVQPGEHLHLHNLKSDYLPTYTLDEDLRFVNPNPKQS